MIDRIEPNIPDDTIPNQELVEKINELVDEVTKLRKDLDAHRYDQGFGPGRLAD